MNLKEIITKDHTMVQKASLSLFTDESGQGMVEYGLILGLIALVTVGVLSMLGNNLYDLFFNKVKGTLATVTN
ncbi:MAG TPA: Flp family type IVb pilin [Candidatus Wallbacteria bacterium]|nr:MAG: Flp/Fap pilin component [bacterium ADurb.Bin243]HOD40532.1 Flp family type IVb pilin [Candidatus Wallbacteria bacterium]HPG56936.1 Flp family type IVb pilin [Candidatus Wallbacteria bacterium]